MSRVTWVPDESLGTSISVSKAWKIKCVPHREVWRLRKKQQVNLSLSHALRGRLINLLWTRLTGPPDGRGWSRISIRWLEMLGYLSSLLWSKNKCPYPSKRGSIRSILLSLRVLAGGETDLAHCSCRVTYHMSRFSWMRWHITIAVTGIALSWRITSFR